MVLPRSRAIHVVWKTMLTSQVLLTVAHGTARSLYCMEVWKYDLHTIARLGITAAMTAALHHIEHQKISLK